MIFAILQSNLTTKKKIKWKSVDCKTNKTLKTPKICLILIKYWLENPILLNQFWTKIYPINLDLKFYQKFVNIVILKKKKKIINIHNSTKIESIFDSWINSKNQFG